MIAASTPVHRPPDARLLVSEKDRVRHIARALFPTVLRPGDLVVVNDAATLPASLEAVHPSGEPIEVRLAGRPSLNPADIHRFTAILLGLGDYRTPTEERPPPPRLSPRDTVRAGPLEATVVRLLDHPRLVELDFRHQADEFWAGLAEHGRPIQYAHVPEPLRMWDTWTRFASRAVAFEPPSAGFLLDWGMISELRRRRIGFASITLAAGISSTGDSELDRRLPLDEPYEIPRETRRAIARTRARRGRVIAIGTTVTRALESAADRGRLPRVGSGVAKGRIGPDTRLRVADAIVSGTHVPGESHYEVLSAFAAPERLRELSRALEQEAYRTHEFGDSLLVFGEQGPSESPARHSAGRGSLLTACSPTA